MKFIDLRSDTVTEPTDEMRQAMLTCEVGDDVYDDDPTMKRLEALSAKMLGKEAALFVASGTMGNQLAILAHTRRGDEIIVSKNSHVVFHECGGAGLLSGVNYHVVANDDDMIYKEDVLNGIRDKNDIHYPNTGLLCLENALGNGKVVPLNVMKEAYDAAHSNGVPVHLDGARFFNAAEALGVSPSELAKNADSIQFCLSKGLCSPIGSILCGSNEFIMRAKRYRKLLGGGLRQTGILAACGIISLEKMTKRLKEDHANAKYLAEALAKIEYIEINPKNVEISMVFFKITKPGFDHDNFVKFMLKNNVKINPQEHGEYRFVTHNYITKERIDYVFDLMNNYSG